MSRKKILIIEDHTDLADILSLNLSDLEYKVTHADDGLKGLNYLENEGRTANHEFVVVGFTESASDNLRWDMKLPELHYSKSEKYALAVWVSEMNNPTPLQVVGGFLPGYKK